MSDFDPAAELEKIREIRQSGRLPRYWRGRSQLDPHTGELLALHNSGASANDLRTWLQERQNLRVDRSTVARWLQKQLKQRTDDKRKRT